MPAPCRRDEVDAGRAFGSAIYVESGGCVSGQESYNNNRNSTIAFRNNYGVCGGALHVEQVRVVTMHDV